MCNSTHQEKSLSLRVDCASEQVFLPNPNRFKLPHVGTAGCVRGRVQKQVARGHDWSTPATRHQVSFLWKLTPSPGIQTCAWFNSSHTSCTRNCDEKGLDLRSSSHLSRSWAVRYLKDTYQPTGKGEIKNNYFRDINYIPGQKSRGRLESSSAKACHGRVGQVSFERRMIWDENMGIAP